MTTITIDAKIIDTNVNRICAYHESAMRSMGDSLKDIGQAGLILAEERDKNRGSFSQWVQDNLPFTRKTAYAYIKVGKLVEAGMSLENFSSMRQAILSMKPEPEEGDEAPRERDRRVESIPSLCMKIERAFDEAEEASPISSWDEGQIRAVIRALDSLLTKKTKLERVLA